ERQRRRHAGQDLVAEAFVDRAHGGSRRRGKGAEPLDHRPAARLGLATPDMDGRREVGRRVLRGVAAKDAVLLVATQTGRERHELVGLGAERPDEDAAGHDLLRWQPITWSSTMPEACMKA